MDTEPAKHTLPTSAKLSVTLGLIGFIVGIIGAFLFFELSTQILLSEILRAIVIAASAFAVYSFLIRRKRRVQTEEGHAESLPSAKDFIISSQSELDRLQDNYRSLAHENDTLEQKISDIAHQLEISEKELSDANVLFGAAFYTSAQLASISDMETGRFIDVNDMWVDTRGITRDEAIGKTADELNIWGSQFNREKIIDDIKTQGRLRNYETTSVMRSGEVRDFILNADVVIIDNRELLIFSGMDITDRKQYQQNLQRAQKLEAVGQLTGGIAHDFNNLLAIILGNLELIKDNTPEDPHIQKLVNSALRSTDRGVSITNKLLSFSGRRTSGNEVTQINALIEGMKDLIAKSVTASILVKTELSEDIWPVEIDPGDFEDAIVNLSINAQDAMPEGGTLTLKTFNTILDVPYVKLNPAARIGEHLAIEISDTGAGFPDVLKDRIFEPFFTTKGHGKGTGLGLSMVFGFVQRSRGHIKVDSKAGKGTVFTLYLPKSTKEPQSDAKSPVKEMSLPRGTEKILIVDDESSLVDVAKTKLEELGYIAYQAGNGADALSILKEEADIDLLFSDVVMPGDMNGYQLSVTAKDLHPDLKILLTSGFTKVDALSVNESSKEINLLKQSLLSKPYSHAQLAITIRDLLDN